MWLINRSEFQSVFSGWRGLLTCGLFLSYSNPVRNVFKLFQPCEESSLLEILFINFTTSRIHRSCDEHFSGKRGAVCQISESVNGINIPAGITQVSLFIPSLGP